jgi:signal transduction histidine kinase
MAQTHVERAHHRNAHYKELVSYVRLCFFIGGPAIGILLGTRVARSLQGSILKLSTQLCDVSQEMNPESNGQSATASCELPALEHQVHEVSGEVSRLVQELDEVRQFSARSERLAAVGMLAAGVAHELRNPLTSIKLMIQLAARQRPEHSLTERQVQVAHDEIIRMEHSIQSLLDFARMPRPNCIQHELSATIERALRLVRPHATQLGVSLHQSIPDYPTPILGDPIQLQLVFANLLLNGLEDMPEGGALHIAVTEDDPLPDTYSIKISDTGYGIPQELIGRVFEPFGIGKTQGYGLGLTICRRIIMEHGGIISASNQPQGGAIFTVELPRGTARFAHSDEHTQLEPSHVHIACH